MGMRHLIPILKDRPVVSVLRLQGQIGTSGRSLDLNGLAPLIDRAFRRGHPVAVALEINSPGGSAVQSSLIAARIRSLAEEKGIPVFAFVEDVAASGGYWLASAADEIYVDATSMVGSIGVITATFGLTGAMEKAGVERRVYTAGESKSLLDPFGPEKPEDVTKLKGWLAEIHQVFIAQIKSRRGAKLVADENLFTGEIWIGETAVAKGLADGLGHLVPVMRRKFGDKVQFRRLSARRSIWQRFGAQIAGDTLAAVEERASYARFGL